MAIFNFQYGEGEYKNHLCKGNIATIIFYSIFLFLFILSINQKREDNYEIYYEKKELVNYIELEKDNYTCSIFGNVFTIKGIIKYKITIRERGEIPIHCHQIGKYIINSLNFPSVKSEIIRHYNNKADMTIVKSKKKKPMSENINVEICALW